MTKRKDNWVDVRDSLPTPYEEVNVWVDGKRGSLWKNNYALVAYVDDYGVWHEERHYNQGEGLVGVLLWQKIETPTE